MPAHTDMNVQRWNMNLCIDYAYTQKYGFRDHRGGGRSSARETAVRVAAGAVARKWLNERYGVEIRGWMSALGPIDIPFVSADEIDRNAFFAPNAAIVPELETYMDNLRKSLDSVGAKITVMATGVPPGWGEPHSAAFPCVLHCSRG